MRVHLREVAATHEPQGREGVPPARRSRDGCATFDRFMAPIHIHSSELQPTGEPCPRKAAFRPQRRSDAAGALQPRAGRNCAPTRCEFTGTTHPSEALGVSSSADLGLGNRRAVFAVLYLAWLMFLPAAEVSAQTVVRWVGGSGSWSDTNHWDIGKVPSNAGATTYIAVIDLASDNPVVTVSSPITVSGLVNGETIRIEANGTLTLSGGVTNIGATISAEGGVVAINGSTVTGGVLRVSDSASSRVRFSGDVTMNGVTWEDLGAGEFQIYNTTARLLGDYEHQLPAEAWLVVESSYGNATTTQWTLPGGVFTNEGVIELRDGGWGVDPRLYWEASGTLAGGGEVIMSGAGDWCVVAGAAAAVLTIGPDQWVHGRGDIQVAVVNQGTVVADIPGKPLQFSGGVENRGVMRALAGCSLVLLKDLNNQGKLQAKSGTIEIDGGITLGAGGTLETEGSGSIRIGRHLLTAAGAQTASTTSTRLTFDGEGVPTPHLSTGVCFVEAEDFNFNRGQHQPESDTMPYFGGSYQGKGGRDGIDYHQTDNRSDSDLYRTGEGPAFNVNIYSIAELDRGAYNATNNYKVGWNDAGEWYNYTRSYPAAAPPCYFFARLASGGRASAVQLDEVIGDANTVDQTLNKVGEARGPATGDYNRFAFVPLRDGASNLVALTWSGTKTFRVTILPDSNEDVDYFVLAPAASSGPAQLLEVMGQDLGPIGAAFSNSVALGSLTLLANSQVQLVDLQDNSAGGTPEALYVSSLVVPAGATLDLNGLKLYALDVQVAGTILNGTVQHVVPTAPVLEIRPQGPSVEISWPTASGSFTLESTESLAEPGQWHAVITAPVVVGSDNTVSEPIAGETRFYRLRSN
jgi:hypothetical protein